MLGAPDSGKQLSEHAAVALKIRGTMGCPIYILGRLNLKDALRCDGSPLPPLIITHCIFVETIPAARTDSHALAAIDISRASLARLSLRGTSFSRLLAVGCQINGDCDLGDRENDPQNARSQLRLDGSRIGGTLTLSGRRFRHLSEVERAEDIQSRTPPHYGNCAVDLSGIEISGDLVLVHCDLAATLIFRDARVTGHVRIMGCTIRDNGSGKAIDGQSARIDGSMIIRSAKSGTALGPFVNDFVGSIFLHAIRVEGEFVLKDGSFIGVPVLGMQMRGYPLPVAFALQHSQIAGTVHIGSAASFEKMYVEGALMFDYASLGGGLTFTRIVPKGDERPCEVRAHGITIDKGLAISDCHFVSGSPKEGIKATGLDFWRATIGLNLRVNKNTKVRGSMRINSSRIGRDVVLRGDFHALSASEEFDAIPTKIDISSTTIEGSLRIGGRTTAATVIQGAITLDRTVIEDRMILERINFDYENLELFASSGNGPLRDIEQRWHRERFILDSNKRVILDLNGLQIKGSLIVRDLQWLAPHMRTDNPHHRLVFKELRDISRRLDPAVVDLRGLTCGALNDQHGAAWTFTPGSYCAPTRSSSAASTMTKGITAPSRIARANSTHRARPGTNII